MNGDVSMDARTDLQNGESMNFENVRRVQVNAYAGDDEARVLIEVDEELDEVRVRVDDECVWSIIAPKR